jgi:hypothetical protein
VTDRRDRPDWAALRRTARHTAESWALEAAQQRKLANEYRDHLASLAAELRGLQRQSGNEEHSCPTCDRVAASLAAEHEGGAA